MKFQNDYDDPFDFDDPDWNASIYDDDFSDFDDAEDWDNEDDVNEEDNEEEELVDY